MASQVDTLFSSSLRKQKQSEENCYRLTTTTFTQQSDFAPENSAVIPVSFGHYICYKLRQTLIIVQ